MYGYVSINARTLAKEDYARFRAVYCGLCHALAARYGQASRLTLSYDMTVLQLLLSSLYDEEETQGRERCAERPVIAHHYACGPCADYAADMSILLAHYKSLDDQADEGRAPRGVKGRAVERAFEAVREKYPDKCARIDAAFRENSRLEREDGGNIDAAAAIPPIARQAAIRRRNFFRRIIYSGCAMIKIRKIALAISRVVGTL